MDVRYPPSGAVAAVPLNSLAMVSPSWKEGKRRATCRMVPSSSLDESTSLKPRAGMIGCDVIGAAWAADVAVVVAGALSVLLGRAPDERSSFKLPSVTGFAISCLAVAYPLVALPGATVVQRSGFLSKVLWMRCGLDGCSSSGTMRAGAGRRGGLAGWVWLWLVPTHALWSSTGTSKPVTERLSVANAVLPGCASL